MASFSPLILKKSQIIQAIGLPVSERLLRLSFAVGCGGLFLEVPYEDFLSPLAILKSRPSKPGSGFLVHSIAALGYCEERETSLLKLIIQLLNSVH